MRLGFKSSPEESISSGWKWAGRTLLAASELPRTYAQRLTARSQTTAREIPP